MGKRIIKIGDKYGKLTVIADTEKKRQGKEKIYLCKCECGNEIELRASSIGLHTKSCGCNREKLYSGGTYLPALQVNKTPQSNNTSGHVGVQKSKGKWTAHIGLFGKKYYLGRFDSYEEACKAREEAEYLMFVPVAKSLGKSDLSVAE